MSNRISLQYFLERGSQTMRTRTCYRLRDVSWLVLLRSGTQSSPVSAKRCGLELPTRFYGRVRDDSFRIRPVGMRTMACICGKVTERDEEKVLEVCLRPRSLIWVFLTVFCRSFCFFPVRRADRALLGRSSGIGGHSRGHGFAVPFFRPVGSSLPSRVL